MTATRINPKVNDLLVVEEYSTTVTFKQSSATYWSITGTKPGYTPIMYSQPIYGWSGETVMAPEGVTMNSCSISINGFGRKWSGSDTTPTIRVRVLWLKNQ